MTDVFIVTMSDGTVHNVVLEEDYFQVLLAMKSLVEEQRKALRSKDKSLIVHCKERERALIDFVTNYEVWRSVNIELFGNKEV